jgi:hypothetical protein
MFKVGDIIKVRNDHRAMYAKSTVNQSYVLSFIVDSKIIVGAKSGNLIGMKDNQSRHIDMSQVSDIFELDVTLIRKLKLEKICSKLVIG